MRIRSGHRNLLGFVAVALVAFGITVYLVPASSNAGGTPVIGSEGATAAPVDPGAVPDVAPTVPEAPVEDAAAPIQPSRLAGMRGYVLPLAELRGVSASSTAGSRIEIWVTWRRDVGGGPQVQRVVRNAVLGEIREPTVPEGPETVEIFIPVDDFPDFLAAHEFGSLNAALVP